MNIIFGVDAEQVDKQVSYLIDEWMHCGKGANAYISMEHHFLRIEEQHLEPPADNCPGQNKNARIMWCLCWRPVCQQLLMAAMLNLRRELEESAEKSSFADIIDTAHKCGG